MKKRFVVLGLLLLCLGGKAQDAYVPSPENLEARKEFQDSKFGIFLHWGLYSMLAQGESGIHLNLSPAVPRGLTGCFRKGI